MTIRELIEEQRRRMRSPNPAERLAAALLIPRALAKLLRELRDFDLPRPGRDLHDDQTALFLDGLQHLRWVLALSHEHDAGDDVVVVVLSDYPLARYRAHGSLGDVLGHKRVWAGKPDEKSAFPFAKKPGSV